MKVINPKCPRRAFSHGHFYHLDKMTSVFHLYTDTERLCDFVVNKVNEDLRVLRSLARKSRQSKRSRTKFTAKEQGKKLLLLVLLLLLLLLLLLASKFSQSKKLKL